MQGKKIFLSLISDKFYSLIVQKRNPEIKIQIQQQWTQHINKKIKKSVGEKVGESSEHTFVLARFPRPTGANLKLRYQITRVEARRQPVQDHLLKVWNNIDNKIKLKKMILKHDNELIKVKEIN